MGWKPPWRVGGMGADLGLTHCGASFAAVGGALFVDDKNILFISSTDVYRTIYACVWTVRLQIFGTENISKRALCSRRSHSCITVGQLWLVRVFACCERSPGKHGNHAPWHTVHCCDWHYKCWHQGCNHWGHVRATGAFGITLRNLGYCCLKAASLTWTSCGLGSLLNSDLISSVLTPIHTSASFVQCLSLESAEVCNSTGLDLQKVSCVGRCTAHSFYQPLREHQVRHFCVSL